MSPDNSLDQHVVTAVVVAHDGAGWLPRVAEGVLQQTRPVQRAVAVDTGSRDRSGAMLAGLFGRPAVFGMDRKTGYAAAVAHALRHRAANTHLPGWQRGERIEWVWLIHDDCEPAPDALEELLRAATATAGVAVLGPKVRDWTDRRVILEAGITIDRAGRRITGVEPREVDQGQHDGDRDVLAVSSAGMLIRRDVWDRLGGFDPAMRLFREDVDFCWRAQAAGHRVRLVTAAVVYHLEASARNRRDTSAAPRPRREDRRNALVTLLGNLPGGPMLWALLGNTVLSLLRTLFYLVAKRPGAGVDEFTALMSVAAHPLRLLSIRRPRARGRRAAYSRLRTSIPAGRTLARLAEFLAGAWSKSAPVDTVGSHHATEDPSDDDFLLVDSGLLQRILTSPGVLLFLGLTVVALAAERSLLGGGALGGGALLPAWGGASDLWQEYLQGFHPAGIGSAASTPPYVAVLAILATVLFGKTWLAVDLLLIGCVPLAGLTAYLAARRVTRFAPARVWAAAAYALLPAGMGAVAAGRLGSAVVFVLAPLIGLLAARIFTEPRRRARRAAWAVALLTAIAAAFVPVTWLIVAILVGIGGLTFGRSRPGMAVHLVIVAAVPPLLLLPWSLQLATSPARLFLESGLQQPGLAQADLPARSLLLLSPGGPGLPPYWVTAGLVVSALAIILLTSRHPAVRSGWSVALAALLIAAGVSRLLITPPGGGQAVAVWPGPLLAFAGGGLVLAVATAGDVLPSRLGAGRWRAPAGLSAVVLALAACSAPALAAAKWVMGGVAGPVARVASPVLPEFVSVAATSGLRPRTLVLQAGPHGSVSYEVLRGSDPLIGSEALTPPPPAQRVLDTTVAALAAPSGGAAQNQGQALASLGIGYVLLPASGDGPIARALDGVAGLRPVSQTATFQLWRVVGSAARVRVVEAGGKVVPVSSGPVGVSGARAPSAGGELVLAEPAGGWTATLNGQPLAPLPAPVGGWAQGFRLPAGGGTLSIGHSQWARDAILLLQCLAVLAVAGLGLPGARTAGEETKEGAESQRRSAGGRAGARSGNRPAGRRASEAAVPGQRDARSGRRAGQELARLAAGAGPGAAGAAAAGTGRPRPAVPEPPTQAAVPGSRQDAGGARTGDSQAGGPPGARLTGNPARTGGRGRRAAGRHGGDQDAGGRSGAGSARGRWPRRGQDDSQESSSEPGGPDAAGGWRGGPDSGGWRDGPDGGSGGYPAGSYRDGYGAGYPAGDHRTGGYQSSYEGAGPEEGGTYPGGRHGIGRGRPGAGGGARGGGSRGDTRDPGGYGPGQPPGEHGIRGGRAGGYPAGDPATPAPRPGGYAAGRRGRDAYGRDAYGRDAYGRDAYGRDAYGRDEDGPGDYPASDYPSGGYPAGEYPGESSGGYPAGGYRDADSSGDADAGYDDDAAGYGDDAAGYGNGRARASHGRRGGLPRRLPGRRKPGGRSGRRNP